MANMDVFNTSSTDLDLFVRCWRLQTCDECLRSSDPCAWCAVSQTCVPNDRLRWPFGLLSPIRDENVCPLGWRERWEMRAKPFSCRCSTMTLISVVVSVLSTLAGVMLLWLLVGLVRCSIKRWKKRQPGWWKIHHYRWRPRISTFIPQMFKSPAATDQERQPLLN